MTDAIVALQKFVHKYTTIEVIDPNNRSHSEGRYDMVDLAVNVHSNPNINEFALLTNAALPNDKSFELFRGRSKGCYDIHKWIGGRIMGQTFMALFAYFGFGDIKNPYVDSKDKGTDAAARLSRGMDAPRIQPTQDGKEKFQFALLGKIPGPEIGAPKRIPKGLEA